MITIDRYIISAETKYAHTVNHYPVYAILLKIGEDYEVRFGCEQVNHDKSKDKLIDEVMQSPEWNQPLSQN